MLNGKVEMRKERGQRHKSHKERKCKMSRGQTDVREGYDVFKMISL